MSNRLTRAEPVVYAGSAELKGHNAYLFEGNSINESRLILLWGLAITSGSIFVVFQKTIILVFF